MKFNFEQVTDQDWSYIPDWYKGYDGWENEIPREWMPGNGLYGYKVTKDDTPIAIAWLYLTNSKLACLNPVVANPNYREPDRAEALEALIIHNTEWAKSLGAETMWGHTQSPTIAKMYEKIGWDVDNSFECNLNID